MTDVTSKSENPTIITEYDMDETGRITEVQWGETAGGQMCTAKLDPANPGQYVFSTKLIDDETEVVAPDRMSLANCILYANMHLGLIPPMNFPDVESLNQH